MTIRVRFFAGAAEAAGTEHTELAVTGSLDQLMAGLKEHYGPEFSRVLDQCSVMVSGKRHAIDEELRVPEGATVDVLPPFAGG